MNLYNWSGHVVRLAWAWLLLAGLLASPGHTRAAPLAQSSDVALTLIPGLDGYYKEGMFFPLRVQVENSGPDVNAVLEVTGVNSYSGGDVLYTRAVELPTQSRREIFVYISPEGFFSVLRIRLQANQKTLAEETATLSRLSQGDLLYGVMAGSPSAFSVLNALRPPTGQAATANLAPDDLPPNAVALQALNVLVISDVDTGAFSPEQRLALAGWVQNGGRLIVTGGAAWAKTTAGLEALLPVAANGERNLADLGALSALAKAPPLEGETVMARSTLTPEGVALIEVEGEPLAAARRLGHGQVIFLAVDPAFAPLRGWEGLEGLFSALLSLPGDLPGWAALILNWSSARDAVNTLPNLELPSPFLICGFLGLYVAVLGPANYFFLRWLKRMELAWLTIPVLVIGFSGVAYITGWVLRGSQVILHQLAIVQVMPDQEMARADQLVGLFSPDRTTYDLRFAPGFLVRPLSDAGAFGAGGGSHIEAGDAIQILNVRTDIGSVQAFASQGLVAAPQFDVNLTLDSSGPTPRWSGTVTNRSELTLQDAVILGPGFHVSRIGDFRPGQTQTVDVPLASFRASQAQAANLVLTPFTSPYGSSPSPYYAPTYNSTIDDILGTSSYYTDRELFRKFMLLSSALNVYSGQGRGQGIYLVGWTQTAPAPAQVTDALFRTIDLTAYILTLDAAPHLGNGTLTLTPDLMTWTTLDSTASFPLTPYDVTLDPGLQYTLRFQPAQLLDFQRVQGLTLRLISAGSYSAAITTTPPQVELWDVSREEWVRLEGLIFGDNVIEGGERFVGLAGEIHVRISNDQSAALGFQTLDFTLTVEH